MDFEDCQEPRLSFGNAAGLYDRVRPGYPQEAVRWILEPAGPAPLRVVDLGAGTGILTRVLLSLGHTVIPVEPDPEMRAQMIAVTPGTMPLDGCAESIPVPDGSVDAVLAGQAYHWFDVERAHPEIARTLRPGGVFGPIWNDRDENVSWLAELSLIANGLAGRHGNPQPDPSSVEPWFAPVEQATFRHSTSHTVESLVELITSRSYYLTAPPERQAKIRSAVRTLASDHPDLEGHSEFDLPYLTKAYRTTLVPPERRSTRP